MPALRSMSSSNCFEFKSRGRVVPNGTPQKSSIIAHEGEPGKLRTQNTAPGLVWSRCRRLGPCASQFESTTGQPSTILFELLSITSAHGVKTDETMTNEIRQHLPLRRYTDFRMPSENLIDVVNALSPEEQTSVLQFIHYLKRQNASSASPFLQAAEQFIQEHPELLHRLSQ